MSDDDKPRLSLAPVVDLPCVTRHDTAVDKVLTEAVGKMKHAVVLGWTDDGTFYFASNKSDGGECLWLLEMAKGRLMKAGGA